MLLNVMLKKTFGTKNDRELKKLFSTVSQINSWEHKLRPLSDRDLQAKTPEFKQRFENGESLDQLLPEAFAVCREASSRVLGMRQFDVQMIGGMALHQGKIAEMKTGEGKTLVATLPCYLNGLSGGGVHVVTVNDYLAKRDANWMGRVHRFLGLEVGCILNHLRDQERKDAYAADITYGTNNEFGFDYLRDNMKPSLDLYVQREHVFAIVDEVDSILIDEAKTPLIISGPSEESTELYYETDRAVRQLKRDIHYTVDEKHRSVVLTEDGVLRAEELMSLENLYSPGNSDYVHHLHASLKAHATFTRDKDYVIRGGEVIIVDEFTGRLMPGRRWSDGLHQAVEAKEGVSIEPENQTMATITLQNYFRLYDKLSGMTGTADTEAAEFKKIYGLDVLVIPTNKPLLRDDRNDLVYRNEAGKFRAVVEDIKEKHEVGRPTLVGTVSVAKSERLSKLLSRAGIPHNILNAKNHAREAEIIAEAGDTGGVTIATNMAGRGTDIVLGEGVRDAGGLHVIGTERHDSRRIDNQLRGRAGRQGDPGSSQFYLSLEDDLMRIFASDRVVAIMDRLGMEEDVPISDKLVTKSIANAQKRVEMHNFDQREHLLKYDDVLNKQREVIYSMRRLVLEGKETRGLVKDLSIEFAKDLIDQFAPNKESGQGWDWKSLGDACKAALGIDWNPDWEKKQHDTDGLAKVIFDASQKAYDEREARFGEETMRELERYFFIQAIDHRWKEHLLALDHIKEGIHLRGYAQKDPLVEYRKEGFSLFKMLDRAIRQSALSRLYTVEVLSAEEREAQKQKMMEEMQSKVDQMEMSGPSLDEDHSTADATAAMGANGRMEGQQRAAAPASGEGAAPAPKSAGTEAVMNFMKDYEKRRMGQIEATQSAGAGGGGEAMAAQPVVRKDDKVGRNDPCPCGSGKKFKHCHGR